MLHDSQDFEILKGVPVEKWNDHLEGFKIVFHFFRQLELNEDGDSSRISLKIK